MLEIIRSASAAQAKAVLFDFDGTLSLIRTGWMDVMIPMMIAVLKELGTGESETQLRDVIEGFVWRLTGMETIYQMIALADEVRSRGGVPLDPLRYKQRYLELLDGVIHGRLEALRTGACPPDQYLVPGARPLLESLKARGLSLYLASGTDEIFVNEEVRLLDIARYFDGGIYGALDDYKSFSKRILIQRILEQPEVRGNHLLGFGDGYVEIEEVRKVGGVTVGVATDEPECLAPDEWKRGRLIGVGADYVIPNFLDHETLLKTLFGCP